MPSLRTLLGSRRLVGVFIVLGLGLLASLCSAYLLGWWGGYRHAITLNSQLFAVELKILNGSLSP